jgi:hypothetical protein
MRACHGGMGHFYGPAGPHNKAEGRRKCRELVSSHEPYPIEWYKLLRRHLPTSKHFDIDLPNAMQVGASDWQKSPDDMEIRETDFITEDSSIDMLTVEPDVLKRGHGCAAERRLTLRRKADKFHKLILAG